MRKKSYRVCEGAILDLYPAGTKVGDILRLTDAQALYELDMGRLEPAEDTDKGADRPADKGGGKQG